jgi:hypothetical protein
MSRKRNKHRQIKVGDDLMISLCETCVHMPGGKVPQSNNEKSNGDVERPHMYCSKKAFFPEVNYNNQGKPFYDVAKCDGYQRYNPPKDKPQGPKEPEIQRVDE